MNNLNDYIIWRGELAFSRETFSPIDMLIFSQLVYTPLENINPSDYGKTLRELYPSVYPNGAPGGSTFTNEDLFGLWKHVARSVRFGEARLEKFVSKFDASAEMQFAAATFSYRGTYIVAFRGNEVSQRIVDEHLFPRRVVGYHLNRLYHVRVRSYNKSDPVFHEDFAPFTLCLRNLIRILNAPFVLSGASLDFEL